MTEFTKSERSQIAQALRAHGRGEDIVTAWVEALHKTAGGLRSLIARYALGKEVPGLRDLLEEWAWDGDKLALELVREGWLEIEAPLCGACNGSGMGYRAGSCGSCRGRGVGKAPGQDPEWDPEFDYDEDKKGW